VRRENQGGQKVQKASLGKIAVLLFTQAQVILCR